MSAVAVPNPPPIKPEQTQALLTLLAALIPPGAVSELRYIQRYPNTAHINHPANGYFDDSAKLVAAALRFARQMQQNRQAYEAWVTLNPVHRHLLNVSNNGLRLPAGWLTVNRDVTRQAALVVRFQGKYPAAVARAYACGDWYASVGSAAPAVVYGAGQVDAILAVSLPNTPDSTALVQQVLAALDRRFSDDSVQVDHSLSEPALLVPLYGIAPRSRILYLPGVLIPVDANQLQTLLTLPISDVTDPIRQAMTDLYVLDNWAWTPTNVLHQAYQALCEQQGLPVLASPHFTRALVARFGLEAVRHKVQGVMTRGIQGIRLKRMNE